MTENIERFVGEGRSLLQTISDSESAHSSFEFWDSRVAAWLDRKYPDTGLSAEWSGVSFSCLRFGENYDNSRVAWREYVEAVRKRLEWLGAKAGEMTKATSITQRLPSMPFAISKKIFGNSLAV